MAIQVAFGQLLAGWLELLPKLVVPEARAWPAPKTLHVRKTCS